MQLGKFKTTFDIARLTALCINLDRYMGEKNNTVNRIIDELVKVHTTCNLANLRRHCNGSFTGFLTEKTLVA